MEMFFNQRVRLLLTDLSSCVPGGLVLVERRPLGHGPRLVEEMPVVVDGPCQERMLVGEELWRQG